MHSTPTPAQTPSSKSQPRNQNPRTRPRPGVTPPGEVLHVDAVFWNTLVVDCKLDEDEVGCSGDVEGEAKGEVVRADGCLG